jgi:hypothetical protein
MTDAELLAIIEQAAIAQRTRNSVKSLSKAVFSVIEPKSMNVAISEILLYH